MRYLTLPSLYARQRGIKLVKFSNLRCPLTVRVSSSDCLRCLFTCCQCVSRNSIHTVRCNFFHIVHSLICVVLYRWGRTNCPFDNMLVYQGRAASSQQSGSGANPLCVTATPLYLAHDDGNNGGAQLFGAQYVWNSDVAALKSVNGKRIPCAVCMIPNKGSNIMVPGENFCPFEWKIEYWGYLMASRYSSNAKSNWVCIDSQPEALDLSASGSGQVYWYATEIECGGMACSRSRPNAYVLQRELTCAVCSPTTFRRTAVYIRYGQNHCPSGSSLVRAGFVAGEHHGHGGSSASILCMTPNASYADHNDNSQDGARLYGYEYETSSNALRSQAYKSVHNHEVSGSVL